MAQDERNKTPLTPREGGPEGSRQPERRPRFSIWIYAIIFLVLLAINFYLFSGAEGNRIEYSQFLEYVEEGLIAEVEVIDDALIRGMYTEAAIEQGAVEVEEPRQSFLREDPGELARQFTTTKPADHELTSFLTDYNDTAEAAGREPVAFDAQRDTNWFGGIIGWLIPLAIIIGLWIFLLRRMNPGQQVFQIGKNKAVLYDAMGEHKVTFKDVAGLNEAKGEVEEVVEFLQTPKKFTKLGGKLPKGVLLVGPPGTGKTLLAKAVAGEAGVPFFSLSGSDFVEMFVGVGAARVRDLFKQAKEKAPCIVFIDEIDAIGRSRSKGMMMGGNDERENTLNQLLVEMDGFNTDKGVIIMAATNRPDILDTALLRPGRFDRQIMIDRPDRREREAIFRVHTRNLILDDDVDHEVLASQTPGFAGAEIANICNEAALLAARLDKDAIHMDDFEQAIDRVIAGLEKKNKIIKPEEREIVAYHEAGHAITGWFQKHTDPVIKVSIVPRGFAALGYAQSLPDERHITTEAAFMEQMIMMMGGRAAEEIIFGHLSTGARSDLERITKLAYAMVVDYGMSERIGHISFNLSKQDDQPVFNKPFSDETARVVDEEVKRLIGEVHERAHQLLVEKRELVEKMAKALLEKEVLGPKDLVELLGPRPYGQYIGDGQTAPAELPTPTDVADVKGDTPTP